MRSTPYPSDVTDAQWALIEPLLPLAKPGGRPRTTDLREVVNAIFYVLRTGCPWRYLPKDFPPKSTVFEYYTQWSQDGVIDEIHDGLRTKVRAREKPYAKSHTRPGPAPVSIASRWTRPKAAKSADATTPKMSMVENAIS